MANLLQSLEDNKVTDSVNVNVILTTHSPFVLSDIPQCNILYLENGEDAREQSVISEGRNAYDEMLSALQNITPLAVTASVINFSSFISIPLALVTSLFAMTRKRK